MKFIIAGFIVILALAAYFMFAKNSPETDSNFKLPESEPFIIGPGNSLPN